MRVYVSRKVLVAMAGLVWIAAGANILKIGIYTWMNDALQWQLKLAGAVVIFCLFFFLYLKGCTVNTPGELLKWATKIIRWLFLMPKGGSLCCS